MKFRRYLKAGLLPVLLLSLVFPAAASGKTLVGVILSGNIPYYQTMHQALADELNNKLPAGEEVEFILQKPFPDPVAWSNSARKLIVGGVDMVISYGYPATAAALSKKSSIPIVYVGVYDPLSAIKEGKITGCGYKVSLSRLFEYLREVVDMKRLCVIFSHNEGDSVSQMKQLVELSGQQGIDVFKMDVSSHKDLKILHEINAGDAVFVSGSTFTHVWMEKILAFLRKKNVPVVDIFPDAENEGVLLSLHQPAEIMGQRAAELAAEVIAGKQPEAIEQVVLTDEKLVINKKEAMTLGITLPDSLLGKASQVIE